MQSWSPVQNTDPRVIIRSRTPLQTTWQKASNYDLDDVTKHDFAVAACFSCFSTGQIGCLSPVGTSNWMPPQCNRWVHGGDKTLNVLSRLFRNVGEELSDPYVLFHMAQLSGLFRSHPNQRVSLELAVGACLWGIKSINHSWDTYWNQQRVCAEIFPSKSESTDCWRE